MNGQHCSELPVRDGAGHVTGDHRPGAPEHAPWPVPSDRADELELWPFPSSVGCARAHVSALAREWGLSHLVDDLAIITSELMTNAVEAATETIDTYPVLLRLFLVRGWLIVETWDYSKDVPEVRHPDVDEESGRGLLIVAALADSCGYDVTPDGRKSVWAKIRALG